MTLLLLIVGLIGLWLGSTQIVNASKAIALRLGLSELLIGVTVVSIGTSLPEIMVTVFSGTHATSDIAVGAMVGSSIAQITLVLGIAGLIHNVKSNQKALQIDGPMMLIAIFTFGLLLYSDSSLSRFEGALMIWLYLAYLWYTSRLEVFREHKGMPAIKEKESKPLSFRIGQMIVGLGILLVCAQLVMENAIALAQTYELSEAFIGVMLIGVASSLPEFSTTVVSMLKGSPNIAVGTLIGSNITNPLLAIGIGSLINGFDTNMELIRFDLTFWFLTACIAIILLKIRGETLHKGQALILLGLYVVFTGMKLELIPIPEWLYLF